MPGGATKNTTTKNQRRRRILIISNSIDITLLLWVVRSECSDDKMHGVPGWGNGGEAINERTIIDVNEYYYCIVVAVR